MLRLILSFLSLTSLSFCLPAERVTKRAGTFPITGASDGSTSPRLEISTLAQNADQFNLYLLVMQNFMLMPQSTLISYYQVAGIHGVPNVAWDGATEGANTAGAIGYCTHSTQLFPAWHRAYLALFEQAFLDNVQTVIKSFPSGQQARWQTAAKGLRIPYWDWAAPPSNGQPLLPSIITTKYITVEGPNGNETIINPLFRYQFHPLDHSGFIYDPFDNWDLTFRYPNSTDPTAVVSNEQSAINTFANQAQSITSSIYTMFTQCQVYATFSTDQADNSDPACSTSLEAIHGGIHNDMGGTNGHMAYLPFAAFDPTFWLHHANVDRLFAMWQAIYPNSYMTENSQVSQATYAYAQGTTVNGNFGMQPFHKDTVGTTWTPDGVRDWTIFNYTYPEFVGNDGSSQTITQKVNQLYGSTSGAAHRKARRSASPDPDASASPETSAPDSSLLTPTGRTKDWSCNIVTSRFGLSDSYTIYVFLGAEEVSAAPSNVSSSGSSSSNTTSSNSTYGSTAPNIDNGVPTDPSQWPYAITLVGSYGIFSMKDMASTKPDSTNPLLVSGSVPLTTALVTAMSAGQIHSLDASEVVPFLRANLNWRVRKLDGTAVANRDVPGLSVSIATADVEPASSEAEFPTWGNWEVINDATTGKHGGLGLDMAWDFFKSEAGSDGWGSFNLEVSGQSESGTSDGTSFKESSESFNAGSSSSSSSPPPS